MPQYISGYRKLLFGEFENLLIERNFNRQKDTITS